MNFSDFFAANSSILFEIDFMYFLDNPFLFVCWITQVSLLEHMNANLSFPVFRYAVKSSPEGILNPSPTWLCIVLHFPGVLIAKESLSPLANPVLIQSLFLF